MINCFYVLTDDRTYIEFDKDEWKYITDFDIIKTKEFGIVYKIRTIIDTDPDEYIFHMYYLSSIEPKIVYELFGKGDIIQEEKDELYQFFEENYSKIKETIIKELDKQFDLESFPDYRLLDSNPLVTEIHKPNYDELTKGDMWETRCKLTKAYMNQGLKVFSCRVPVEYSVGEFFEVEIHHKTHHKTEIKKFYISAWEPKIIYDTGCKLTDSDKMLIYKYTSENWHDIMIDIYRTLYFHRNIAIMADINCNPDMIPSEVHYLKESPDYRLLP